MIMELLITMMYWGVLHWNILFDDKIEFLGNFLDHSVPLFILLADYVVLNQLPFVRRHLSIVFLLALFYVVFNCVFSLFVSPIYI